MTEPTGDEPVGDEPVDYVNERYTTGGEGPDGQPDTVDESASQPDVAAVVDAPAVVELPAKDPEPKKTRAPAAPEQTTG